MNNKDTIQCLRMWTDENNCMPKAIVGDEAFFQDDFLTYYRTHGIKELPCGARTPWPNRAETAVRLFKRQWEHMTKGLEDDRFKGITVKEAVKKTVWARNTQLTISGYSPLEIATGRRPPDLLDIETFDPAQLSTEPLAEDRTLQELQRLALKAHQEARQAADLRHDMAKRTMPSDGPYKPGEKVFVWMAPASTSDGSFKSARKEKWVRGTVINQEGAMVNVQVDSAIMRVNQSKVRRDHDEWHDVAVPGLDTSNPSPEIVEEEDDYAPEVDYAEAYFGEQSHWFYQTGKCDVVELFSSSTGLSWHMSNMDMKVGIPIDHKHGFSLHSKKKQLEAWRQLESLDPEYVLITNPSPIAWKHSVFQFCLEVMLWQHERGKGFVVITPPDSGFAHFLNTRWKLKDRIKRALSCTHLDMSNYITCDPSISTLYMFHNREKEEDMIQSRYTFKSGGKPWTDPHWKRLPSRLCSYVARFTRQHTWIDGRQLHLIEDLLHEFDDGALCGASLMLDHGVECSCLLQEFHNAENSFPVPLKHILPQRFTTPLLVQTLRKVDQLPRSTEASVIGSTDPRIMELIPGLQDIRQKTLPQMMFEQCSVFRGTYGRVNPLFQHPEDAVLIIWKPGDYDHVYFMFASQLYPHHEQFRIHDWSMIVYSHERTGAIKRRVEDPPPVGVDPPNPDDAHPDQHGHVPPNEPENDMEPVDPIDDDQQSDYQTGPEPDDDEEYIYPDDHGPPPDDDLDMPGVIQDSGEPPSSDDISSPPFSNPDLPIEEIVDPGNDDDDPGPDPTSEPIRVQRKQRTVSIDSTDALPKAKAKVIIKRPKVPLPGHVQPISAPMPKDFSNEDDEVDPTPDPTASSSHDHTVPLPTTTPTSFTPGDFSHQPQQQSAQEEDQESEEFSSPQEDGETEPYHTDDTPILTEEEITQLQEDDLETNPYHSDHSNFVEVDGDHFVLLHPKLHGAPEFGSYDVTGFKKFQQFMVKNGKKPKAESVITQEVLRKYAKEIKQAKLEEFRSFLDFTAMTFRDKRRHKIDNYVTGRWVLTSKVDKDGKFKKFKARWVCRGFQDAQKYDRQTDSPTATRYGFRVASQHAASQYWDLLHLDLKTAFLQGETYDLDRRIIHVQLPTDIGLPPYSVGCVPVRFMVWLMHHVGGGTEWTNS